MPRPLKDELELRLALSKEDLYIKDIPRSDVISFSLPAVSIADSLLYITQVPAIKKKGLSLPTLNPHKSIFIHS